MRSRCFTPVAYVTLFDSMMEISYSVYDMVGVYLAFDIVIYTIGHIIHCVIIGPNIFKITNIIGQPYGMPWLIVRFTNITIPTGRASPTGTF